MFFILLIMCIVAASMLGFIYCRLEKTAILGLNRNLVVWTLWLILALLTILICSNRATLGLVFNSQAPDIDFIDTLNSNYINVVIVNCFFAFIIYGLYYFLRKKLKIAQPIFIIALLIFTLVIYYPGINSLDGDYSYNQFLTHHYDDWHPPIFTLWWNLFRVQGATFMADITLYYAGLIGISYYLLKKGKNWQNDLLVIFSLNPLLFSQLTIVWKDISFTAVLIDALAIYLLLPSLPKGIIKNCAWLIYGICLFLATGFRINGIFAVLPFIFLFLQQNCFKELHSKLKIVWLTLITLFIGGAFMLANNFITYKVFAAEKLYMQNMVLVADMANIECATNHEFKLNDSYFLTPSDEAHDILCEKVVNGYNHDALYNPWGGFPALLKFPKTYEGFLITKNAWLQAITTYPLSYLIYRGEFLVNDLFFPYWYPTNNGTSIVDSIDGVAHYQHMDMKFILTIFMITASCACLILCIYFKNFGLSFIILVSSILQLGGWYFLIPAHPARYFLWNYLAALFAIILFNQNNLVKNSKKS